MIESYNDAVAIYKKLYGLLGDKREWIHYDQTFRAAGSVAANVAEGEGSKRGRGGNAAYRWATARGSLYETLAWVDIAIIEGIFSLEEVKELKVEMEYLATNLDKLIKGIDDDTYKKDF